MPDPVIPLGGGDQLARAMSDQARRAVEALLRRGTPRAAIRAMLIPIFRRQIAAHGLPEARQETLMAVVQRTFDEVLGEG